MTSQGRKAWIVFVFLFWLSKTNPSFPQFSISSFTSLSSSPSLSPLILFSSFSLVIVILFSFFLPSPLIFYSGWASVCVLLTKTWYFFSNTLRCKYKRRCCMKKNTVVLGLFIRSKSNCLKVRLLLLFCCLKFDIWTAMEETRLLRFD